MGKPFGHYALARLSAEALEAAVAKLEQTWRQRVAADYRGKAPAPEGPTRAVLEQTIPVLRVLVEAKRSLEKTEDVLGRQIRRDVRGHQKRLRADHTAHRLARTSFKLPTLEVDLPYPPSKAQVEAARVLVEQRYRATGLLEAGEAYQWSKGAFPLVALQDHRVISTLSIIADEEQLPVDLVFPEELRRLRGQGVRLFEVGAFATDPDFPSQAQTHATMTLVDLAVQALRTRTSPTLGLIAVHPHHAGFYVRRMGATKVVSDPRPHPKVQDAPAILLSVDGKGRARSMIQELAFAAKIVSATLE